MHFALGNRMKLIFEYESDHWWRSYDGVEIFKMAAVEIANRFLFGSVDFLGRSGSLSVPNFVTISQSTAELKLLPVWENERPLY